jgi:hypothetical protein
MIAPVIAVVCALVLALTWSLCSIATRAKSPATAPLSVTALGNLIAPNNQYFVARGSGGFEVGGESGPLISSDAPDTVTITSKRSTTNLTVQPGYLVERHTFRLTRNPAQKTTGLLAPKSSKRWD